MSNEKYHNYGKAKSGCTMGARIRRVQPLLSECDVILKVLLFSFEFSIFEIQKKKKGEMGGEN